MDRVEVMQVFLRVAEAGSFTRAADQLSLPRATVSAAVQQLEATLGTRLLHRTTRSVQLTQDGTALLERCRNLLAEMDDLENLFRHPPGRVSGKLKVDVPSRIGRCLIAPALPAFFERYPDLELELGATDRSVDLVQEGVDCVIRIGNNGAQHLAAHPFGHFIVMNCTSPTYLQRHGTPVNAADLADHWAVNFASPTTGRVKLWEYFEAGEYRSYAMRSRVTVNNGDAYLACAIAGMGMIQMLSYGVHDLIARGELVEVMPHARAEPMPVCAYYPNRHHLSRRVKAFIDWMEELLRPHLRNMSDAGLVAKSSG